MEIFLVERYAYDSNLNGDGFYIDALLRHLKSKGHSVRIVTTNMLQGRTKPFFKASFRDSTGTLLRKAFCVGSYRISYDIAAWVRPAVRALKIGVSKSPRKESIVLANESAWLLETIKHFKPQCVILIYNGSDFCTILQDSGLIYLAVPVFLKTNISSLKERVVDPSSIKALSDEVAPYKNAPFVGFHSNDDVKQAAALGVLRSNKVGIGVSLNHIENVRREPQSSTILFVAALAPQNVESANWFIDEVLPTIVSEVPSVRLRIVGSVTKALENVRTHPNVDLIGFVDDILSEYSSATVVVAPLVSGSKGMKVKVAEALAYACPLVATSISIDSADHSWARSAMRLADTPSDFAAQVIAVIGSPLEQRTLSQAAATAYKDHICCDAAYRKLDTFLDSLI